MPLSRIAIVDRAITLLDRDGIDGLSMRTLAADLDVTAMAIYRHVADRDALLDEIVDRLLGQLAIPAADLPWQRRLRELARSGRRMATTHPHAAGLLFQRASTTRHAATFIDAIYIALLDAGVPARDVPRIERLTTTFVLGFAASEANGRFAQRADRATRGHDLPGHQRLRRVLNRQVDWSREFDNDIDDLIALVEQSVT